MLLVAEALSEDGWSVELGEPFQRVEDVHDVDLLAVSISRTDQWQAARDRIDEIRDLAGPHLQVMVGGAAFRKEPNLASRMGADGWAEDLGSAVALAERLCAPSRLTGVSEVS